LGRGAPINVQDPSRFEKCEGIVRMDIEDSRIIARFQRLLTGSLAAKRLGQWRSDVILSDLV